LLHPQLDSNIIRQTELVKQKKCFFLIYFAADSKS